MKKTIKLRLENAEEFIEEEMTLEEVIDKFKNLVFKKAIDLHKKTQTHQNSIDDVDDLNSLGTIELMNCYNTYDSQKSSFSNYLTVALDKLEVRYLRDLFAQKRTPSERLYSFDGATGDLDAIGFLIGVEDEMIGRLEFDCDLNQVITKLNKEEKKILKFMTQEEKTKKALAEELGMSRPTLNTKIDILKDKISNLMDMDFKRAC